MEGTDDDADQETGDGERRDAAHDGGRCLLDRADDAQTLGLRGAGPGSLQVRLLDALHALDEATVRGRARLEELA